MPIESTVFEQINSAFNVEFYFLGFEQTCAEY